jgi:hypothetical protein
MSHEISWLPRCFICKESVNLEECKTDEHGRAVHEDCYVWHVILKKPRRVIARTEPVYERRKLMTPLMSAGGY